MDAAKCAAADDIGKEEDEENRRNTMASGDTAAAHHIRRKKKKILPGSAVILRVPPPPPPPGSPGSGCASCPNCYLGHSCCHQPLPEFPSKGHVRPPPPPPHLQPQARIRYAGSYDIMIMLYIDFILLYSLRRQVRDYVALT